MPEKPSTHIDPKEYTDEWIERIRAAHRTPDFFSVLRDVTLETVQLYPNFGDYPLDRCSWGDLYWKENVNGVELYNYFRADIVWERFKYLHRQLLCDHRLHRNNRESWPYKEDIFEKLTAEIGIAVDSTQEEVNDAFREFLKTEHPDRWVDSLSEEEYRERNEVFGRKMKIWNLFRDPSKREKLFYRTYKYKHEHLEHLYDISESGKAERERVVREQWEQEFNGRMRKELAQIRSSLQLLRLDENNPFGEMMGGDVDKYWMVRASDYDTEMARLGRYLSSPGDEVEDVVVVDAEPEYEKGEEEILEAAASKVVSKLFQEGDAGGVDGLKPVDGGLDSEVYPADPAPTEGGSHEFFDVLLKRRKVQNPVPETSAEPVATVSPKPKKQKPKKPTRKRPKPKVAAPPVASQPEASTSASRDRDVFPGLFRGGVIPDESNGAPPAPQSVRQPSPEPTNKPKPIKPRPISRPTPEPRQEVAQPKVEQPEELSVGEEGIYDKEVSVAGAFANLTEETTGEVEVVETVTKKQNILSVVRKWAADVTSHPIYVAAVLSALAIGGGTTYTIGQNLNLGGNAPGADTASKSIDNGGDEEVEDLNSLILGQGTSGNTAADETRTNPVPRAKESQNVTQSDASPTAEADSQNPEVESQQFLTIIIPNGAGFGWIKKEYGLDEDVVVQFNPQLKKRGLRRGEQIKIPTKDTKEQAVASAELVEEVMGEAEIAQEVTNVETDEVVEQPKIVEVEGPREVSIGEVEVVEAEETPYEQPKYTTIGWQEAGYESCPSQWSEVVDWKERRGKLKETRLPNNTVASVILFCKGGEVEDECYLRREGYPKPYVSDGKISKYDDLPVLMGSQQCKGAGEGTFQFFIEE